MIRLFFAGFPMLAALVMALLPFFSVRAQDMTVSVGAEAFRSWGVATDGIGEIPLAFRFTHRIEGDLWLSVQLGYEYAAESGIDEIRYEEPFIDGNGNPMVRRLGETTSAFDQAFAISPGLRYDIPGGPDRLHMFLGFDAVGAYYPGRRTVTNQEFVIQEEQGAIISMSESERVGTGFQGWGYGLQANVGLEVYVLKELLLGVEFGPGNFSRTREGNQQFVTTGVRPSLLDPTAQEPFTTETERTGPDEQISGFRFRGMVYLGWAL